MKIDGEDMGTTPLAPKNYKAGTYSVTFSAEGYETQTKSVTVTAGETTTCDVTLMPATGTLFIVSNPSGAIVLIDGKHKGKTPLPLEKQNVGTYSVTFSAEGYETQTKNVTVTAGETTTCDVTLVPETGTLFITSTPSGAAVKIGDKFMGETPLPLEKQNVGMYEVSISAEGYETYAESVTVTAGKTATCNATLTPASSQTFTVNGVLFTMIRVEGGTFTMGATSEQGLDAFDDEKPTCQVTLSSYYIGETEVTQGLWEAVMGTDVSFQCDIAKRRRRPSLHGVGSNYPMYYISWVDCQTFINRLNALTKKHFRLPTEAEWEFAARGGNETQGYKYSGSDLLNTVAWYEDNSDKESHPVKTKAPNELGIYDMSGNVWEWCQDWNDTYVYYSQTNPMGPSVGTNRVRRGGSWNFYDRSSRVSNRGCDSPDNRESCIGFRLAL